MLVLIICATITPIGEKTEVVEDINYTVPIFKSLIMPGWGEYTLGNCKKAKLFLAADALSLTQFVIYFSLNRGYNKGALLFAAEEAGANGNYFNEGYLEDIENYSSSENYNLAVKMEARGLFPSDIEKQKIYIEKNSYYGDKCWEWTDPKLYEEFRNIRKKANSYRIRSNFMLGISIFLRMASIFDTRFFTNLRINMENKETIKLGIKYKLK